MKKSSTGILPRWYTSPSVLDNPIKRTLSGLGKFVYGEPEDVESQLFPSIGLGFKAREPYGVLKEKIGPFIRENFSKDYRIVKSKPVMNTMYYLEDAWDSFIKKYPRIASHISEIKQVPAGEKNLGSHGREIVTAAVGDPKLNIKLNPYEISKAPWTQIKVLPTDESVSKAIKGKTFTPDENRMLEAHDVIYHEMTHAVQTLKEWDRIKRQPIVKRAIEKVKTGEPLSQSENDALDLAEDFINDFKMYWEFAGGARPMKNWYANKFEKFAVRGGDIGMKEALRKMKR